MVHQGLARLAPVWPGLAVSRPVRYGNYYLFRLLGMVGWGEVRRGTVWIGEMWCGIARLGSTRYGLVRFTPMRCGMAGQG